MVEQTHDLLNSNDTFEMIHEKIYKMLRAGKSEQKAEFALDVIFEISPDELPVFNTSLRDGSISELSFLSKVISPLVQAYKGNNDFEVLKIVKEYSPLMESKKWISLDDQTKALQQVESAVDKLMELWKDDAIPTCLDVLRSIQDTGL